MQVPIYFIIPAAGFGQRMESAIPKQHLHLAGKSILHRTLTLFDLTPEITGGVLVLAQNDQFSPADFSKPIWRAEGGETRFDSVLAGLQLLKATLEQQGKPIENVWVAVHDAARPGLLPSELSKFLQAVMKDSPETGGIMAIPAPDTLKMVDGNHCITKTIDRTAIWQAQTPQMVKLSILLPAMESVKRAGVNVTDEASVLEYNELFPKVYRGYTHNFKVTYPEDLALMSLYFKEREQCE